VRAILGGAENKSPAWMGYLLLNPKRNAGDPGLATNIFEEPLKHATNSIEEHPGPARCINAN